MSSPARMQQSNGHPIALTFQYARQHMMQMMVGVLVFSLLITFVLVTMIGSLVTAFLPASQLFIPADAPVMRLLGLVPFGNLPGSWFIILFGPVILGLCALLLSGYILALGVEGQRSILGLFGRAFGLIAPLIMISLWTWIRSFLWVPMVLDMFIGMGAAIGISQEQVSIFTGVTMALSVLLTAWYLPRLIFAPLLYIRESLGMRESVSVSLRRTQGMWGHITWQLFLWALVLGVIGLPVSMVLFFLVMSAFTLGNMSVVVAVAVFAFVTLILLLSSLSTLFTVILGMPVTAQKPQGSPVETPVAMNDA